MPDSLRTTGPTDGTADPWVPSALEQERSAWRRARAVRSTAIAAVSTVVLLVVAAALVVTSPGWPRVRSTFFSWDKAVDALPAVLEGLWLNIRVMLVCAVLIGLLGLTLAVMRTIRGPVAFPLRLFATAYVDLFRGLPLLLVLFLLGFGAPALRLSGLPSSALFWGCVRARAVLLGLRRRGVPRGDRVDPPVPAGGGALPGPDVRADAAARRHPAGRAPRRSAPDERPRLAAEGLRPHRRRSGVIDAIRAAQIETARDFNFTPYVVAGALFVCLTIPMARFTDHIARKRGYAGVTGAL